MLSMISRCKPVFLSMAILAFLMATPRDQVLAAIVRTESCISEQDAQQFRAGMQSLIAREEVRAELLKHGIDPLEAGNRINALTDEEVLLIASKADFLIIGGNRNVSKEQKDYGEMEAKYILIPMLVLFAFAVILSGIMRLYDNYFGPQSSVRRYSPPKIEPPPPQPELNNAPEEQ